MGGDSVLLFWLYYYARGRFGTSHQCTRCWCPRPPLKLPSDLVLCAVVHTHRLVSGVTSDESMLLMVGGEGSAHIFPDPQGLAWGPEVPFT